MHTPCERKKYDQRGYSILPVCFLRAFSQNPLPRWLRSPPFFPPPSVWLRRSSIVQLYCFVTVCVPSWFLPTSWVMVFIIWHAVTLTLWFTVLMCVCACACTRMWTLMSDSSQTPYTVASRPLCPWGSPGRNTGVGCHFPLQDLPNPGID